MVQTQASARVVASLTVACLTACAGPDAGTQPCPDGTYRDGAECVAWPNNSSGGEDAGSGGGDEDTGSGGADVDMGSGGGEVDMGSGEPAELAFPFAIDTAGFVPTGFFGDGETPGGVLMAPECPSRPDGAQGVCHDVTWKVGVGGAGFAGVFWQYPDNNWGALPGREVPEGVTHVTFKAWGASGGEVVKFLSGISDADGFARETAELTLTTTPTDYEISLKCVEYDDITGAFGWAAGDSTEDVHFYIDDIQWRNDGDPCEDVDPGDGLALPFSIDDEGWTPSGFMGDAMGIMMDDQCPERAPGAEGLCHRVIWDPSAGSPGWAGVFWQYPENNWGTQPGLKVLPGATSITLWAWGEVGGEVVKFGSGYANEDGFAADSGNQVLTTTPTQYTIDLSAATYDDVRGAFNWTSEGTGSKTFYIDGIRWN